MMGGLHTRDGPGLDSRGVKKSLPHSHFCKLEISCGIRRESSTGGFLRFLRFLRDDHLSPPSNPKKTRQAESRRPPLSACDCVTDESQTSPARSAAISKWRSLSRSVFKRLQFQTEPLVFVGGPTTPSPTSVGPCLRTISHNVFVSYLKN